MPSKRSLRLAAIVLSAFASVSMAAVPALAESTVQGSQNTSGATSIPGSATGTNTSSFQGGPSSNGGTQASTSQIGSNTGSSSQSGTARGGDAVAATQVTGAVADDVTVQNQNTADDSTAIASAATMTQLTDANFGALATTDGGTGLAQASQNGDNAAAIDQTADAASGDAVAGSQITGIVGDGQHTVQNQNDSTEADAIGGVTSVANTLIAETGADAISADDVAQADQIGDNGIDASQAATSAGGDAVAGSQIAGVVGGSADVQQQDDANDISAIGGVTATVNTGVVDAGPAATTDGGSAAVQQSGDNAADLVQDGSTLAGDAVAGSQITGGVGDGGEFTVQEQLSGGEQAAIGSIATAVNTGIANAGPRSNADNATTGSAAQIGDNAAAIDQSVSTDGGDAVGGSQITGDVGHEDVTVQNQNSTDATAIGAVAQSTNTAIGAAGPVVDGSTAPTTAQTSQSGDNALAIDQAAAVDTGDAVAASQVSGIVADGGEVRIQNENSSAGDAIGSVGGAINVASLASAGPAATASGDAQTSQLGDDRVAIDQAVTGEAGDAVATSQINGVVNEGAGATTQIQGQNTSDDASAIGSVASVNNTATSSAGPLAEGTDSAFASQTGDVDVDATQAAAIAGGDSVAGSQVSGVVTSEGAEVTLQEQNSSTNDTAVGSLVSGTNVFSAEAGPSATSDTLARAEQIGDDAIDLGQAVAVDGGDAVAGSQISGIVGGDAQVQVQNDATNPDAIGGPSTGTNTATGAVGPNSDADDAGSQQAGDTDATSDQGLDVTSGDAVAGAQINGAVA